MNGSAIPLCTTKGCKNLRTRGTNSKGQYHRLCEECHLKCPICPNKRSKGRNGGLHPVCAACWRGQQVNNVLGNQPAAWAHVSDRKQSKPVEAKQSKPVQTGQNKQIAKVKCACKFAAQQGKACSDDTRGQSVCEACTGFLCSHYLRFLADSVGLENVRDLPSVPVFAGLMRCANRCSNAGYAKTDGCCSKNCVEDAAASGEPMSLPFDKDSW
jgi:hypothetical protein